jgi:hypothetical protein
MIRDQHCQERSKKMAGSRPSIQEKTTARDRGARQKRGQEGVQGSSTRSSAGHTPSLARALGNQTIQQLARAETLPGGRESALPDAQAKQTNQAGETPGTGLDASCIGHLQRCCGNQYVGQLIQRGEEEEGQAATEGVEVPGVTGSGPIGLIGDILGALDTAVGIVDLFGVAALEAGGSLAVAPFITGPLAAIAFIVGGVVTTVEAGLAGEKLAAVQGASYGITSVAFGRPSPSAPGWMGHGEQFNRSASQVRERITEQIEQRGEAGQRMAGALASLRQQGGEAALNSTYQRLVEEHLQLSFLGFEAGGGLYANARRFRLTWPQVGMNRIREE